MKLNEEYIRLQSFYLMYCLRVEKDLRFSPGLIFDGVTRGEIQDHSSIKFNGQVAVSGIRAISVIAHANEKNPA